MKKPAAAIDRAAPSAGGAFVGPGQTTRIELWRGSRRWARASFFDPELGNLRLQPKSALSRFAPVSMRNVEGSKGRIPALRRSHCNGKNAHIPVIRRVVCERGSSTLWAVKIGPVNERKAGESGPSAKGVGCARSGRRRFRSRVRACPATGNYNFPFGKALRQCSGARWRGNEKAASQRVDPHRIWRNSCRKS